MDEMLFPLLVTTEDRYEILSIIDYLLSLIYTKDSSLISSLYSNVPDRYAQYFINQLQKITDTNGQERWLATIRNEISSMEKLSITLAFHPSRSVLDRLIVQVRKQYGQKTLIELHCNYNVVAGVEIVYKGIYRDGTIRPRLTEVLESVKSQALY